MNDAAKKRHCYSLLKEISLTCGGDDHEWFKEYALDVISRANDLDLLSDMLFNVLDGARLQCGRLPPPVKRINPRIKPSRLNPLKQK